MIKVCVRSLLVLLSCSALSPLLAQSEFGFVNTKPSGQPYLPPEESLRRMHVPPEYEVKLFAAEPDIINPISFTIDERGRLWVVECYEYPKRTPKDRKPRDRIKILEDTTGAGKADKVSVWAEGKDLPRFDLASGIEVGHGGVFLGAAPYLFFLSDISGAGRCDHHEMLLRGFGSQDTHEVLNTLQWGPDGRLHGLQGIFTESKVGGVQMNAAVWRYEVDKKKFDLLAEGTSNPWGLDFDKHGQAFLTACVIPHAFHIIPGGTYIRQAGNSRNPYAYGLLHEISDHLHHSESGWAHAGALVMQGDHVPSQFQNSLLMGSIHGCSIKRDLLEPRGSTFVARHAPDFLVSGDKNFRPINMRWGPDGSIYVIDWHDQNPCHQALPDSWDMTHGRIYKIQRKGTHAEPPGDLSRKSSRELVELLKNDNPWWYRTALRLLAERRDLMAAPMLEELLAQSKDDSRALRAIWGLYAVGAWDETLAKRTLHHESPWVRSWTVRLLGESGKVSSEMMAELTRLAMLDPAPEVRLQLACTAQRLTGQDTVPLLQNLMHHQEDAHDPDIPLMIWLAYEPRVAARQPSTLAWLGGHASDNPLITDEIVPRALRRMASTGNRADLEACVDFLNSIEESSARRRALEGLLQALQNRDVDPPPAWSRAFQSYVRDRHPEVVRLTRRLAVKFHDLQALRVSLSIALDREQSLSARVDAIRDLAIIHPPEALRPLEGLLAHESNPELCEEVCRTLAAYDSPGIAAHVLAGWKSYPPAVRTEVVDMLAGRKAWARELLAAVGRGELSRADLNNNTILHMRALHDKELNAQIERVWGRVRDTMPAELEALISQMRNELYAGRGSFERGRKVFEDQCAKCHRFEGRGHDVGPNLDGAARDIEYLLVNVLDPNRVVGKPYYKYYVALKDGRVETGLLAAEDEQSITLKTENDALKVFQRKTIEDITVEEKSLMPEGLNKNMTVADFRHLIRYVMVNPFLTDAAVAGPIARGASLSVDLKEPLHSKDINWAKPIVGPPGKIALPSPNGVAEVDAYVTAAVMAPEAMETRLLLGAGSAMQVWVNGVPTFHGKPGEGAATPDQAGVDVHLQKGANQLLFRITYRGNKEALFARLVDPQRKLKYPEPK